MSDISYKSIVSESWQITKQKFPLVIGAFLIPTIVQLLFQSLMKVLPKGTPLYVTISIFVTYSVLYFIMQLGITKLLLNVIDNRNPKITDLFSQGSKIITVIFASLLLGVCVVIPTVLIFVGYFFVINFITRSAGNSLPIILIALLVAFFLILALFYVSLRFRYYFQIIIDKNAGIVTSLKESWRITNGKIRKILSVDVVLFLINIVGILCLFVGLLVTVPLTLVATTLVYRKLSPLDSTPSTPNVQTLQDQPTVPAPDQIVQAPTV